MRDPFKTGSSSTSKGKGEVVKNHVPEILAAMSLFVAVLLMFHQQITSNDVWFAWEDFWHHEPVIACGFTAAIALVAGKYLGRR